MKRIFCIVFISIICSFSFLTGYCAIYPLPVYGAQDQWESVTSIDELVDAFRAYCKSRNTVIDGSVLDGVTSFTTTTFNNICNTLGINVTLLQAELQRSYSGSGYKYAFSQLGLSTYNRIFAEFLQNNDLEVGQTVDKTVYSGKVFTDTQGNSCLVFVVNSNFSQKYYTTENFITAWGTPYRFNTDQLIDFVNNGYTTIAFWGDLTGDGSTSLVHIPYNALRKYGSDFIYYGYYEGSGTYPQSGLIWHKNYYKCSGYPVIFQTPDGRLYSGSFSMRQENSWDPVTYSITTAYSGYRNAFILNPDTQNTDITITTNNTTINNETVINEGDTYIIDSDGQPDSGGGSGSDDDDWNPVLPDVPGAGSDPSGGNIIDWPDLDLPDFDLPNFSLGDLRLKFPFSIPFDIVSILGVINAPAVAPVIQEDIPIRIDFMNVEYTIPINLDMTDTVYDDFARLVRSVEFIGFCIGLIHLTIRLVKG